MESHSNSDFIDIFTVVLDFSFLMQKFDVFCLTLADFYQ